MLNGIDHVAIGVEDLDERIEFLTSVMGMTLKRRGTHIGSGGRIAFVADPVTGFKIELIETPDHRTGFMHLAFRTDDIVDEHSRLAAAGLTPLRGPLHLDAAKADTALLKDRSGMELQIITYEPDSPDL